MHVNETSGIIEYSNNTFRKAIHELSQSIQNGEFTSVHSEDSFLSDYNIQTKLIVINDLNLTWLKILHVKKNS